MKHNKKHSFSGLLFLVLSGVIIYSLMQSTFFKTKINDLQPIYQTRDENTKAGMYYTVDNDKIYGFSLADHPKGGQLIGKVPERGLVKLYDTKIIGDDIWACVEYAGLTGYMRRSNLTYLTTEDLSYRKGSLCYVNTNDKEIVRGYKNPQWDTEPLTDVIPYGTEFELCDVKDGWGLVTYDNKECWINLYFVGNYAGAEYEVISKNKKEVLLVDEPAAEGKIAGTVPEGTRFQVSEFAAGYARISDEKYSGWIRMLDLQIRGGIES